MVYIILGLGFLKHICKKVFWRNSPPLVFRRVEIVPIILQITQCNICIGFTCINYYNQVLHRHTGMNFVYLCTTHFFYVFFYVYNIVAENARISQVTLHFFLSNDIMSYVSFYYKSIWSQSYLGLAGINSGTFLWGISRIMLVLTVSSCDWPMSLVGLIGAAIGASVRLSSEKGLILFQDCRYWDILTEALCFGLLFVVRVLTYAYTEIT